MYIHIYIYIYHQSCVVTVCWWGLSTGPMKFHGVNLLPICGKAELWLVWVSCCLTCTSRISPEVHRNFVRVSNCSTLNKGITTTQPSHIPTYPVVHRVYLFRSKGLTNMFLENRHIRSNGSRHVKSSFVKTEKIRV